LPSKQLDYRAACKIWWKSVKNCERNRSTTDRWTHTHTHTHTHGQKLKWLDSLSKLHKVTKGLYFTYLWRGPDWSDVHENLCSGWCSQRNHVCQVSKWNFQGLRFYRGSNFSFFLLILNGPTTVQRYCAACDIISNVYTCLFRRRFRRLLDMTIF